MRRISLRIALLLGVLSWPAVAMAALPSNVTGLSAHFGSGQIALQWNAPENAEDASKYRVYYSQQSILGNDGAYDDFVETENNDTTFTMSEIPAYPRIFLAVVAVNNAGEESESFVEEVELNLEAGEPAGTNPEAEVSSSSHQPGQKTGLGLMSAIAQSPMTVRLTFTAPVHVPLDRATQAFTALDDRGNVLQLRRIVIESDTVTLTTDPQVAGRDYAVRANDVITSEPTTGPVLRMDSDRSIVTFTGYGADDEVAGTVTVPKPNPIGANVGGTPPKGTGGSLPSSGLPVLGIVLASGALAGWRRFAKRRSSTCV